MPSLKDAGRCLDNGGPFDIDNRVDQDKLKSPVVTARAARSANYRGVTGDREQPQPVTTEEPTTKQPYTNEPGRVIPILEQEFEDFETEATAFLDGQQEEAKFIGFRLKQGVYAQRQPDRQMLRVKLPFGGVTADQLDAFAVIAEDYANRGASRSSTSSPSSTAAPRRPISSEDFAPLPLPPTATASRSLTMPT